MKQTISVVISTYNDGRSLARTLASVAWADEIVVIDNESNDNTSEIAAKFTKYIFSRPNDPMLNRNKNFGFSKATGDWILNLDSDEVVGEALKKEIRDSIEQYSQDTKVNGFWISRKNFIFGKWIAHGFWWPDRQLRLFRRNKGKFPCRYIHEYIKVDGISKELKEPYLHYNYESISHYLKKLERCTTSEAAEYAADGYSFAWQDAIRFPVRDFVKVYFSQSAYKDGIHGLVLSILQAFYSFVIFAKLWEYRKFPDVTPDASHVNRELADAARQAAYWNLSTQMQKSDSVLGRFILRLKRRIVRPQQSKT